MRLLNRDWRGRFSRGRSAADESGMGDLEERPVDPDAVRGSTKACRRVIRKAQSKPERTPLFDGLSGVEQIAVFPYLNRTQKEDWLASRGVSPALLSHVARGEPWERRAACVNRSTPQEAIEHLWDTGNEYERSDVAHRITGDRLEAAVVDPDEKIRVFAAKNPNLSDEQVAALLADEDYSVQYTVNQTLERRRLERIGQARRERSFGEDW